MNDHLVSVTLDFQGNTETKYIAIGELLNAPIRFMVIPSEEGAYNITATVNPGSLQDSKPYNNSSRVMAITKDTGNFHVEYVKITCFGDTLPHYSETIDKAGRFMLGVYPINPQNFSNKDSGSILSTCAGVNDLPTNIPTWSDDQKVTYLQNLDMRNLWTWGKRLKQSIGMLDKVVGITGEKYMNERRIPSPSGFANCGFPAAIVSDGYWDIVVHEIGHTLQLNDLGSENCLGPKNSPALTNGYWLSESVNVPFDNYRSLMNNQPPTFLISPFPDNPTGWISDQDYNYILENGFAKLDPEILLVNGILYKDGRVDWGKLYRLPEGVVDGAVPGEYSIQIQDDAGNVLYELPFSVSFTLMSHPTKDVDTVPFGFAVPYPVNATTVQVTKDGQVLTQVNTTTQLLRDAVLAVPDYGFNKNSAQLRSAILYKVDEFNTMLMAGNKQEAYNKLKNDIRKKVVAWLKNGYQTQTPLQVTKEEVLNLIDELLLRIKS